VFAVVIVGMLIVCFSMTIFSASPCVSELFQLGVFEPGMSQREFTWTETQAAQLLNDLRGCFLNASPEFHEEALNVGATLLEREDEPSSADVDDDDKFEPDAHSLGRLVGLSKGRGKRTPPKEYFLNAMIAHKTSRAGPTYEVFDGLQRLTTLTLLISVLRYNVRASELARELDEVLFVRIGTKRERRMQVSTPGKSLYSAVEGRAFNTKPELGSFDFRIREIHRYFRVQIDGWSKPFTVAFTDFLLHDTFVTLQLMSSRPLAFQAFVSANARGVPLTVHETALGEIMKLAEDRQLTQRQIVRLRSRWLYQRRRFDRGFDAFIDVLDRLTARSTGGNTRAAGFLTFLESIETAEAFANWFEQDFGHYADVFARTRRHAIRSNGAKTLRGVDLRFRQLSFLDSNDWAAVVVAFGIAQGRNGSPKTWAYFIHRVYRAFYIMELANWTASRQKAVNLALDQIEKGLNPTNSKVKGGAYGALSMSQSVKDLAKDQLWRPLHDKRRRGAITRWLETLKWGTEVPSSCTQFASVEHVIPQRPNGYWTERFDANELEVLTDRIGNLCLLDRQANKDAGNLSWPRKSGIYEQWRRRFRSVDDVLVHGANDWTFEAVERRTQALVALGVEELGLAPLDRKRP
jgi:hypothetical protein